MNTLALIAFVAIAPLFALNNEKYFRNVSLILFWLALEYLVGLFVGDVLAGHGEWLRWSRYTGSGGISLWILLANLFLYLALFRKWQYAVVFVIVILAPILYSYTLQPEPVLEPKNEWVARTAAWISVLILLSAFVKELTRKK